MELTQDEHVMPLTEKVVATSVVLLKSIALFSTMV
jgi:hypothetical protein